MLLARLLFWHPLFARPLRVLVEPGQGDVVDAEEAQLGIIELGEHLVGDELIRAEVGPSAGLSAPSSLCSRVLG